MAVTAASLPAGLSQSFDPDGTLNNVTTVTLAAGQESLGNDFGYNWTPTTDVTGGTNTGAIGDRVWVDTDGDGRQDPGEGGLSGITVTLIGAGADGLFGTGDDTTTSTTTDADGSYIFDNVAAGYYRVVVNGGSTPTGYTQTGDPDSVVNNRTNVVLAPGDVYVNADFGYRPTASSSIGDLVFLDPNGNGAQDTNEPGVPGVTVTLLNAGGFVVATTTTDASGNYLFPGLPAGTYTVRVTDTDGVLNGFAPISNPVGDGTLDYQTSVTVNGTTNVLTADFGFAPPAKRAAIRSPLASTVAIRRIM